MLRFIGEGCPRNILTFPPKDFTPIFLPYHEVCNVSGYNESAEMLQREAGLVSCVTPPPSGPQAHAPHMFAPVHSASPTSLHSPSASGILTPRPLVCCCIKDAKSVSLYPYNQSQILQNVKYTK